jgi:hypothetical protein
MATVSPLLELPPELIDHILSFLHPTELDAIAATCQCLKGHAAKDLLWQRHVQSNVPGCVVQSPSPCRTFRELYYSHDPHWFLPKYKVWFSDFFLTGKLVIARYDPRRGCIEAYRLVAERKAPEFEPWEFDDEVIIHSFEPKVQLHMDQPILQLDALPPTCPGAIEDRFGLERPMPITNISRRGQYSNFLFARRVEERPYMELWPPLAIPARHRVRNVSQENFKGSSHRPQKRSEISDQTFRIRSWMEMRGEYRQPLDIRLGEEVYTYSTLDPVLYTPTADKPWRGIWVGDYAGHGCEFLLMHQPNDYVPFDESSIVQQDDETLEEYLARKREARIYRGKIEAIKLTGDPNIPRGEYTFIAPDISDGGLVRRANEAPFKGARIVQSRGHIAERMFRNGKRP